MKRREIFLELDRMELLVIITFSMVINLFWFIPIIIQLENYSIVLTLVLYGLLTNYLTSHLVNKHKEKIKQRINEEMPKHIRDFFDYIEEDEQFRRDVLLKKVDLYNCDREKIGEGSVYTQIAQKREKFLQDF